MNGNNLTKHNIEPSFLGGHALIIAIADYPKVQPLPGAVLNDAHQICATLVSPDYCGYDTDNVTLLLNEKATLGNIRKELHRITEQVRADEAVVIFFSGHGAQVDTSSGPSSVLIPFDCDPNNLMDTTLLESEFSGVLDNIKSKRLVVFIDACHSGGVGSLKRVSNELTPVLGFSEKSLSHLANGVGRVIIASSRSDETSLILNGASNSLFTTHLIAALRGDVPTKNDGLIRVFEVFNYISEKVRINAPGRQHPIFKASNLEDNFPISLNKNKIDKNVIYTCITEGNEICRSLEDVLSDLYPTGPLEQEVWLRAGGDVSRLRLNGTGRANWFAALRIMRQGGGGKEINQKSLIETALQDFPNHHELKRLG